MNPNLVKSTLVSIGIHAFLMLPVAFGAVRWSGPAAEVLSGLSSVELEWVEPEFPPAAGPSSERPMEEGREEPPPDAASAPARESWLNDRGALNAAQPLGSFQNPAPTYPRVARIRGWEGRVLVRAWVTPTGGVASARVAQSSGRGILDGAAVAAVQKWRFSPARRRGQVVASQVEVPITFRLKQAD